VNLTPDQARAVNAESSVAVVAGAGTGKTHMLAGRYLHHLRAGLSPLAVVAVTFTDKAAAELRARIRTEVARHLPHHPDALTELEAAQISTLHALAARICREHPEEAGVPPDFAVLEELESAIWQAERLEEALATLPESTFERLPYARLVEVLKALLAEPLLAAAALARTPASWRELVQDARRQAQRQVLSDPAWVAAGSSLTRLSGPADDKGEIAR